MAIRETSESRKAASRANGAKSHGPVTPEGKRNAGPRQGRNYMLARTILLPGESRERFFELYESFLNDLEPANSVELALVEKMAVAHWKQMRLWAFEQASLTASPADPSQPGHETQPDGSHDPDRHALALVSPAQASSRLSSYEIACDRVFARALDRLIKLRRARSEKSEPPT